jgi:hypothetical protein
MGSSKKFVDRLKRSTGTGGRPDEAPAVSPLPPAGPRPRDDPAWHPGMTPEELIALGKIVMTEQLSPPKPQPPPPDHFTRPKKSGPAPASPPDEPVAEAPEAATQTETPAPELEPVRKDYNVSQIDTVLKEAMQIDGAIGVALVDYTSGMMLGQAGGSTLNLEIAAAGNTEVIRAKLRTMEALGLNEEIEDVLITLGTQYHLIRLLNDDSGIGLFLYLALDKSKSNLALARHKLSALERQIEI